MKHEPLFVSQEVVVFRLFGRPHGHDGDDVVQVGLLGERFACLASTTHFDRKHKHDYEHNVGTGAFQVVVRCHSVGYDSSSRVWLCVTYPSEQGVQEFISRHLILSQSIRCILLVDQIMSNMGTRYLPLQASRSALPGHVENIFCWCCHSRNIHTSSLGM